MGHFSFEGIQNNTHPSWWKDPGLRLNVFYCMGCCLAPFYLGYDQSLLTGLQAIPAWGKYFHSPAGTHLGVITASLFFPSFVFCFVGGWMANQFGRRPTILVGAVILVAGSLLNTFARNTGEYIGGRVIMGTGGAIVKVAAPALNQELAHPRLRPTLGAFYYCFYYTGSITSSWLCVAGLYISGNWGWRFPSIFQIVGPIIVCTITLMSPESPRYYIKKGEVERAQQILARLHANGEMNDPLVHFEMREIRAALDQEEMGSRSSYLDFFRTNGNIRRLIAAVTLGLGTNWVGNGLVSYYLSPILKSVGVYSALNITCINAGLAMWNLILAMTGAIGTERWGRRPMFFTSTIGMMVSYAIVMGLSAGFAKTKSQSMGIAVIPFLFFFYGSYDIAWTPLPYHYTTEIMPYSLRTKGLAIFTVFNQVGNAFNQFVNPIALAKLTWKYYGFYVGMLAIFLVIEYFFYPETKGLSLEEITYVFDHGIKNARAGAIADIQAEEQQHKDVVGDNHSAGAEDKLDAQHHEVAPDANRSYV